MQKGFISFSFPTEEVKGVNYFPSRANDLEIWKKIVIDKRVVNSVKYHYLSLRLAWSLFKKFENKCKNKHKLQIKLSKVQTCFLFANAMTVLTAVDFEMAFWSARSGKKTNYIIAVSFFLFLFNYAIQGKSITDSWIPR